MTRAFRCTTIIVVSILIVILLILLFIGNETPLIKHISSWSHLSPLSIEQWNGKNESEYEQKEYNYTGTFKLESSENFGQFLTEMGVSYFLRKLAESMSSEYIIDVDSTRTNYTLKTVTPFREAVITFQDGKEFNVRRMDGTIVKSVIHINGPKWTQLMYGKNSTDPNITVIREFDDNGIKATFMINKIRAVRNYVRI
ncbi:calycin super [Blomia tropicalis]|nr:calycin super [Blomia tropicalis]